MATHKNRIDTNISLINSCPAMNRPSLAKIKAEFRQVLEADDVSPIRRRNILKILHSTRALDSSLSTFLSSHGLLGLSHSMGSYLHQLKRHHNPSISNISESERSKYQLSIVKVRNKHMHEADQYPRNDREVNELLSEMQALIARVVSL